jgi:hypothetical protein
MQTTTLKKTKANGKVSTGLHKKSLADAYAFRNGAQHTAAQHLHRLAPKSLWEQQMIRNLVMNDW